MNIIAKYMHGSEDSTDIDTYYVVDTVPVFQEAKKFCDSIEGENANLISIENGIVSRVYKGTPDECNNSLYDTYCMHEQVHPLLIQRRVERDCGLKYLRATRGILSHLSRSQYRPVVKDALRSDKFSDKLLALKNIDLSSIDFSSLNSHMSGEDIKKVLAFQMGQSFGLRDGIELYSKRSIATQYPKLYPYLYRSMDARINDISESLQEFCDYLLSIIVSEDNGVVNFSDGTNYNVLKEIRL